MEQADLVGLIPRNKHDFERVDALVQLSRDEVAPMLQQLFEWTADGNWPIAGRLARFLLNLDPAPYDVIEEIMAGGDGTAKWFLLNDIMRFMPRQAAEPLRVNVERLSRSTDRIDITEEVTVMASEVLTWLDEESNST